jgi:hypothetical protein
MLYLQRSPSFPLESMIISRFPNVPQRKKDLCEGLLISGDGGKVGYNMLNAISLRINMMGKRCDIYGGPNLLG